MRNRFVAGALAVAIAGAGLAISAPSRAAHHLWQIKQIFSNASGSVQFISLFTSDPTETGVGGFTVTSGGHVFTFGSSLSGTTANKWILIATSNFAAEPGAVAPDYIIPGGFFSSERPKPRSRAQMTASHAMTRNPRPSPDGGRSGARTPRRRSAAPRRR